MPFHLTFYTLCRRSRFLVLFLSVTSLFVTWGRISYAATDLSPYLQQQIVAITIDAPVDENLVYLRRLIKIEPGYILTSADIQGAIKRLYALGRFRHIELFAQRTRGLIQLRFKLTPRQRIDRVTIKGLQTLSQDLLRRAISLRPGNFFNAHQKGKAIQQAQKYLHDEGFVNALVTVRTQINDSSSANDASDTKQLVSGHVKVVITIHEGAPQRLLKTSFKGSPRISNHILQSFITMRSGDIIRQEVLRSDRQRLQDALYQHGFLYATVSAPSIKTTSLKNIVYYTIQAGPRTSLSVVGADKNMRKNLNSMWQPPTINIPISKNLRPEKTLQTTLLNACLQRGFTSCQIELKTTKTVHRSTLHHQFTMHRGPLTRIRHIRFLGADKIAPDLLHERASRVLHAERLEESIFNPLRPDDIHIAITTNNALKTPQRAFTQSLQSSHHNRWKPTLYAKITAQITSIYLEKGFMDVKVMPPQLIDTVSRQTVNGQQQSWSTVLYTITEGTQTHINAIRFIGNSAISSKTHLKRINTINTLHPFTLGGPFNLLSLEDARVAMIGQYRNQGYLYARITSRFEHGTTPDQITVTFTITEGPQVHIQNILIRGNQRTKTTLIRERMQLSEGGVYSLKQALLDRRHLVSLGIFSSVRIQLIDADRENGFKDLVIEVEERNRQPIELAFGISTADGLRLRSSYSHLNLFGTGTAFRSRIKLNRQLFFGLYGDFEQTMLERYHKYTGVDQFSKGIEHDISAGIHAPRLTHLPWQPQMLIDFLVERRNAIPYSLNNAAAIFSIDTKPTIYSRWIFEPQISSTTLECPTLTNTNAGDVQPTQSCQLAAELERGSKLIEEGSRQTLKLANRWIIDTRNNPLNPRTGVLFDLAFSHAVGRADDIKKGGLSLTPGKTFSFTRLKGGAVFYIPSARSTWVIHGQAGVVLAGAHSSVPIDERFYLGGRSTLRGWVENTLIPEDACTLAQYRAQGNRCQELLLEPLNADGTPLPPVTRGGNSFALIRGELRSPLTANLSFELFLDVGNLWSGLPNKGLLVPRIGTGVGLRYNTAVGAVTLDIAINPTPKRAHSETMGPQVHFSIGSF